MGFCWALLQIVRRSTMDDLVRGTVGVRLQRAPFWWRDRALGGALVLPLRHKLPRS
jgi:hypothetical protein